MRFHVIGAGAIGGLTGAFLARQGDAVHFVDVVPAHVDAINADGLFVDGVAGEFRVRAPACLLEDLSRPLDVVLLAVKSQQTDAALERLHPWLGANSLVVSLQNGLNPDKIAARIGPERVLAAFINFSADYIAPGHIRYGGAGDYYLGRLDGASDARLLAIAERFGRFMTTIPTDNIMGYLWSKECYGCMLVGTALVDAPIHVLAGVPEHRDVLTAAMIEAVRVADACGVRLESFSQFNPELFRPPVSGADLDAFYTRVAERYQHQVKQYTGIWRDLRIRRRKTEVEWLTGELIRRGEGLGIPLPVNRRIAEMIGEIERGERQMSRNNLLELHGSIQ